MDNGVLERSELGTPQGGVISPLLANIALDGMEHLLKEMIQEKPLRYTGGKIMSKRDRRNSLTFVRYADDMVVIHESKEILEECKNILNEFLSQRGLELHPQKTKITHTLEYNLSDDSEAGFEFLGFKIKQFPTKYHSATRKKTQVPDIRTLVYPSKKSIKKHTSRLADLVFKRNINTQENLIKALNPVVAG